MAQTLKDLEAQLAANPRPAARVERGDGAGGGGHTINHRELMQWDRNNKALLDQIEQARSQETAGYQSDGSYRLNTNVTDDQAQEMAGRVSREQFERYMQMFAPQEQKMVASLGETRAQDAGATAQADAVRSREALSRMRERYGTSLTGQQQQAESRQGQRATTLSSLSATNTGRQMDQDRKFNMQGTMLNIGNSLSSSAMGGLTNSSNNANAREQAHDQAMSQHKANQQQQMASTVSSIGMIGALAFGV